MFSNPTFFENSEWYRTNFIKKTIFLYLIFLLKKDFRDIDIERISLKVSLCHRRRC